MRLFAGLPQITWALPSVQAALGKSPPSVVCQGVGVRPGGVQLRYAQHRHVHAPVVGGQGAEHPMPSRLAYAAFSRRDRRFAIGHAWTSL